MKIDKIEADEVIRINSFHNNVMNNVDKFLSETVKPAFYSLSDETLFTFIYEIKEIQPINWLLNQNSAQKSYWSDRNGKYEMAGVGEADVITNGKNDLERLFSVIRNKNIYNGCEVKYFGGICFDPDSKISEEWQKFGTYRFHLPMFQIIKENNTISFVINMKLNPEDNIEDFIDKIKKSLEKIDFTKKSNNVSLPEIINKKDNPSEDEWIEAVNSVKVHIDKNDYQKIVLAKRSHFKLSSVLNSTHLLYNFVVNKRNSFTFYFQLDDKNSFIGNTPELLYKRNGRQLFTEAVAGTRERGTFIEIDKKIEYELLHSSKDISEHKFVQIFIENALDKISKSSYEKSELSILKLPKVQHLLVSFSSILNENINDHDIIKLLHPTPAVGGYPKNKTIPIINRIEKFDRGWYAGPVGWIGRESAEFAVGIRSGLVHGEKLSLYAGAGIVKDSDPKAEWNETENKMLNFLRFFECK